MSYYHLFDYVSPREIYAEVKEELRSYFESGLLDDVMFPRYTLFCIKKIGKASYPVDQALLKVANHKALLPDYFFREREIYGCYVAHRAVLPDSTAIYTASQIILPVSSPGCQSKCPPQQVEVLCKKTGSTLFTYQVTHLLMPATPAAGIQEGRGLSAGTYQLDENHIHTSFEAGELYMTYYKKAYDDYQHPLIPDLAEFREYLKSYLKYKCFETLYNNISDETFKQIESKLLFYKQQYEEQFIITKTEFMKKTLIQSVADVKKTHRRFDYLDIQ